MSDSHASKSCGLKLEGGWKQPRLCKHENERVLIMVLKTCYRGDGGGGINNGVMLEPWEWQNWIDSEAL